MRAPSRSARKGGRRPIRRCISPRLLTLLTSLTDSLMDARARLTNLEHWARGTGFNPHRVYGGTSSLTALLLDQAGQVNALRQRIDLLLAATGEGSFDPASLQADVQAAIPSPPCWPGC